MGLDKGPIAGICVAVFAVAFAVGFLGGFFGKPASDQEKMLNRLTTREDPVTSDAVIHNIDPEHIREYLRELTERPHLAGTPADLEVAQGLVDFWTDIGLDRAVLHPYTVLLSYPEADNPSQIFLYDGSGATIHASQKYEEILRPEQNQSDVVPPFNSYSPSGQPKGALVYVNYGRIEDFEELTGDLGINTTDKICIARYGKIFRGNKARHAEQFSCSGLILYSDPADYAPEGQEAVYPDSLYLPGTGVQRGTVKPSEGLGDPLTPGYPAIDGAYRMAESEADLPGIPIHPIGYDDAKIFLQNLAGAEVPEAWKGRLDITYRLGPGFIDPNWEIEMKITTHGENKTTYNAVGFIRGEIEPDRYVVLGNHLDAWVFGSLDPSSGTAILKEVARVFMDQINKGWRPRRTIVFCGWGAEEHGIVGSREWIEQFGSLIGDRAVGYINIDVAVQGNFRFRLNALPMVHDLLYEATKKIPNPDPAEVAAGRQTVYATWLARNPILDPEGNPTDRPYVGTLGAGSDFAPFVGKIGVTCMDLLYDYDPAEGISSYPLYHSVYETLHLVETYYDPEFMYHRAIAQIAAEVGRSLADSFILPLNVSAFSTEVDKYVTSIVAKYGDLMAAHGIDKGLEYLYAAVTMFEQSTTDFQSRISSADTKNPIAVRMLNDQIMQLERSFLDPLGLPGRPLLRNVAFAPSSLNSYAGDSFPGLADSLFDLERATDPADAALKAEAATKQLSVVSFFIQNAATSLYDVISF